MAVFWDEGVDEIVGLLAALVAAPPPPLRWAFGMLLAWSGRLAAYSGRADEALDHLGRLVAWMERAPAWSGAFAVLVNHAAETLWLLDRVDDADRIESAVREKIVQPDFRGPLVDGRLSLARLSALTGRHDEAVAWFAEARRVLEEQGARPLLAITDYDEALMYARRGASGDGERARPLLAAAHRQFDALGMDGWTGRAEELRSRLG
jgi:hypothetical protein